MKQCDVVKSVKQCDNFGSLHFTQVVAVRSVGVRQTVEFSNIRNDVYDHLSATVRP